MADGGDLNTDLGQQQVQKLVMVSPDSSDTHTIINVTDINENEHKSKQTFAQKPTMSTQIRKE